VPTAVDPTNTGLQRQFRQQHGSQRILLGGLEYESVAAHDGHGKHPQRNHRGKIEGRDAGAHADGLAQRVGVHPAGDVLGEFTQLQAAARTGMFDHLEPAKHVPLGVRQSLALFGA
jgi:hypothetical protein